MAPTGKPVLMSQFVTIVSDKNLKNTSLRNGDIMLVLGFKEGPEGVLNDPYLFRKYILVAKFTEDNGLELPNNESEEDNGYRTYIIDPRSVEAVSPEDQIKMESVLEEQFSEE